MSAGIFLCPQQPVGSAEAFFTTCKIVHSALPARSFRIVVRMILPCEAIDIAVQNKLYCCAKQIILPCKIIDIAAQNNLNGRPGPSDWPAKVARLASQSSLNGRAKRPEWQGRQQRYGGAKQCDWLFPFRLSSKENIIYSFGLSVIRKFIVHLHIQIKKNRL